uniref:UL2 uracil-DNA glycosylase n=1 Tax=Meleagrid herpesvirus 1 TaxID=37108 RepID=Q9E1I8_MEHV1|nr:UL2 uracil-DNA glycosylase [Meleagrid alphaherpesvirus 1]
MARVMARCTSIDSSEAPMTTIGDLSAETKHPDLEMVEGLGRPRKRRRPEGLPPGFIPARTKSDKSCDGGEESSHVCNVETESKKAWEHFSSVYNIDCRWKEILGPELCSPTGTKILAEYERRLRYEEVYPSKSDVFAWTRYCAPEHVKVVIVGQDPYANEGQAHGLAFSVPPGSPAPPSLKNILAAVRACFPSIEIGSSGCLEDWARRGVLLLNSVLTVKRGDPGSHRAVVWQILVRSVLRKLSQSNAGLVFMLWGAQAQTMYYQNDNDGRHLVLKYSHPSPLSKKPFVHCTHFRDANEFLCKMGKEAIDWSLTA